MKGTKKQGNHVGVVDPPMDPDTTSANATDSSEEEEMTVPELLVEETNDAELNTLEEELETEEEQAEDADEAETEALESQGFVEGTSPLGDDDGGEDEFEPQIEVSNATTIDSATTQPGEPILGGADVSVLTSNGEVMASASGWGGSKPKTGTTKTTTTSSNEGSTEEADMTGNTTVVEDGDGLFPDGDDNSTDVLLTNVTFNDADPDTTVSSAVATNANATEGEWPSVSELLEEETNDADLDALEEELVEDEDEAEKEDEEEDEELESEGFVMGTDPIENEDDDIEPQIDVTFFEGNGATGNGTDVTGTNHTDTGISSNTTKAPVDDDGAGGDDDDDEGNVDDDGANEDDDQGEQGKITDDDDDEDVDDDDEKDDDDGSETTDDDKQDDDGESTDDDDTQGTPVEGKDDDDGGAATDDDQQPTQVGSKDNDDDGTGSSISDNTGSSPHPGKTRAPSKNKHYTNAPRPSHSKPSSPPMSLPPQTAQVLTTSPGAPTFAPAASDSCVGFMCNSRGHVLPILGLLAFVPLFMIYCWRRYCSAKVDTRGEYRAVAAQYGDVFSDDISDDEADFGDVEDSWGKSGKRTLELSSISQERNGGLSLAEMNG